MPAAQPRPSTAAAEGAGTVARCLATGDRVDAILDSGSGTSRTFNSLTIGTRGRTDIPLRLFDDMGELHGHLQLQCVVTLGIRKQYTDEAKELAALSKKISVDNGWTTADRVKITIKRLQRGQTFNRRGQVHFRTHAKNVSRPDINETLAEYRVLQRAVGVEVSILQLMTWYIQPGLGMPSPTCVTPSGGWPMCPMRADAYMIALMTPELFPRKHCYSLFFSGGAGEFEGMTHDQAKECSHKRMLLEGRLDQARAKAALEKVAARLSTGAVPGLCQDSSDSEGEQAVEQSRRPDQPARH
ncbi:unnamed protein product [Ectocarpus sp. CCAP 1310/34]|nr:unnamed protein product [Ectocarpus sp. CCAP 1310/34]